jgi:hypothetical protein
MSDLTSSTETLRIARHEEFDGDYYNARADEIAFFRRAHFDWRRNRQARDETSL